MGHGVPRAPALKSGIDRIPEPEETRLVMGVSGSSGESQPPSRATSRAWERLLALGEAAWSRRAGSDDEHAAELRTWFRALHAGLEVQLSSQLSLDTHVVEAEVEIFVPSRSVHDVAVALKAADEYWRLALGLTEEQAVMTHEPREPAHELSPIRKLMTPASEMPLELEAIELGSARVRARGKAGGTLLQKIATVMAFISFVSPTPADVVKNALADKPDGTQCQIVMPAEDLSNRTRERIREVFEDLPEECDLKVVLRAGDGTRVSAAIERKPEARNR